MADLAELIPGDVYTRSEIGMPSSPGGSRRPRSAVVGLTGHHTTGETLGESNQIQWVFNIYHYHVNTLNWADIGYAYLYDRYGNVYVGRGRYRTLAHATGYNRNWLGVAYLGDSSQGYPEPAQLTFIGLRSWLMNEGGMTNMSQVNGHGDIGSTACPGAEKYSFITSGMPEPDTPTSSDPSTPSRRYDMLLYAVRDTADSLSAYNVLSQHNAFAVLTHSKGEAEDAKERGEDVVAVGGPAAEEIGGSTSSGVNSSGNVTTVVGRDRGETLRLLSEWAQDNL